MLHVTIAGKGRELNIIHPAPEFGGESEIDQSITLGPLGLLLWRLLKPVLIAPSIHLDRPAHRIQIDGIGRAAAAHGAQPFQATMRRRVRI